MILQGSQDDGKQDMVNSLSSQTLHQRKPFEGSRHLISAYVIHQHTNLLIFF